MPKNIHKQHGENIKKMGQIPENPARAGPSDLVIVSKGNIPPGQMKRITNKTPKPKAKKPSNQTQT
jgi:hypothetical protein